MTVFDAKGPYLLFLADAKDELDAKIATGLKYWRNDDCIGQFALPGCEIDCSLPNMTPEEAFLKGASSMVVCASPAGGRLPGAWIKELQFALISGLDLISGLHDRLDAIDVLVETAKKYDRRLFDIRQTKMKFPIGSPRGRSGNRILTVGTDTCVGKKFSAISLATEMNQNGYNVSYRATGQTGLLISGSGIVIDAVVADFISGAVEILSPDSDEDHWDVIEGQGSLLHPSHAGVTLGLVHGSQPDYLVLCHVAQTTHIADWPEIRIPPLREYADRYLDAASLTNSNVKLLAVCVNSSGLRPETRNEYLADLEDELGVVVVDPVAQGMSRVIEALREMENLRHQST